ncbi:MAG TPA: hypothetical protein VED37_04620 [Ktedonobacteraceae bacterium]|nr:hypothetical protein [Ktedonobacteraceae bacterium]
MNHFSRFPRPIDNICQDNDIDIQATYLFNQQPQQHITTITVATSLSGREVRGLVCKLRQKINGLSYPVPCVAVSNARFHLYPISNYSLHCGSTNDRVLDAPRRDRGVDDVRRGRLRCPGPFPIQRPIIGGTITASLVPYGNH